MSFEESVLLNVMRAVNGVNLDTVLMEMPLPRCLAFRLQRRTSIYSFGTDPIIRKRSRTWRGPWEITSDPAVRSKQSHRVLPQ